MGKCEDCRFANIGEYNQPIVVAHKYDTDLFTFHESPEDIIAIPVYDLECEHESNWRPSRGNMLVDSSYSCKNFEPIKD